MHWIVFIPLIFMAGSGTMPNPTVHNPRYEIVTPDGWTFEFAPPNYAVDIGFFDGGELPPIQHQTQVLYRQPGALLQSISIQPRVVTITGVLNAKTRTELHELRARLWKALRWNRTLDDPPAPSVFRFIFNERVRELNVFLLSTTTQDVGTEETKQNAVVRLVAYDPLWYGAADQSANLATYQNLSVAYIAGKINGLWNSMGGGANGDIYTMAIAPNGDVYVGGAFTSIGGVAANRIAKWDGSTWSALAAGFATNVLTIAIGPDGKVYAGGLTNRLDYWDGAAWNTTGTAPNGSTRALAVHPTTGDIYAGGTFTTIGGVGANRIARWNGSAWSALGTGGADNAVRAILIAKSGTLYAGGDFTSMGGVANTDGLASWNGTTWASVGNTNAVDVYKFAEHPDGTIYASGIFATIGGVSANNIAKWNGVVWTPLGSGVNAACWSLAVSSDGLLYAGGLFTSAGGLSLADRVAVWNGTSWAQLDIDFPGTPLVYAIGLFGANLYVGFDTTGTAVVSSPTSTGIDIDGDFESFPIFTLTGPGTLQWIENTDSAKTMTFNLYINAGETVTIDLTAGNKSIVSDWRGNLFPYTPLIPSSDFSTWALEPDPIAADGLNTVALMMTGTTPTETNDNNNQLSGWSSITGITPSNTDAGGRMYANIIDQGGGFYSVNLYDDSARTHRVGYTASYNTNGAKTVLPDNASGLGGTITVDARVAADSDIVVFFATAKVEWRDAYLSIDEGM